MGLVERALHRAPVQAAVAPRGLGAGRPVGEAQVLADVVALAVVGLDALHAQAQRAHGLRAPPRLALGVGEVDHRARAHPPARDVRLASAVAHEALRLVVGRRLAVQAPRARVGRDLAVERLEVDPRRDPHDRAHPDRAPAGDHPGEVGELVRVGLPRVVLGLPRRVEDDRVERDAVPAAAMDVLLGVLLVRVDVARLPEAVAPGRQQRRQAGEAHVAAQARDGRRVGEDVQAQRAGHGARGDPRRLVELEARAVGVGLAPQRVAAAGLQERRGRVVALGDAAQLAHVGRAVGAGVRAIGAELDGAPGVVDAQRVARAEPGEALLRAGVPLDRQAQRRALGRELEHEVLGAGELDAQLRAAPAVERQRDRRAALVGRARRWPPPRARGSPGARRRSRPR